MTDETQDNAQSPQKPVPESDDVDEMTDDEALEMLSDADDDADDEEQPHSEDKTEELLNQYAPDEETMEAVRRDWKEKEARRKRKLGPLQTLLMMGVVVFVPWYIWSNLSDISYFFSSREAIDLGNASSYRLADAGETTKEQAFEDNRYVRVQGIPIRHVGIQTKENPIRGREEKLVYSLMGSSLYIQEDMENSRFANFMAQTSTTPGAGTVEELEVSGRLRRFDVEGADKYQAIREYYTKKYGTIFCAEMSDSERKRKAALLGRGGLALQIMPDGAVLQSETQTHASLRYVEPMRGRSAMVIGDDNTILNTNDAGLNWSKAQLTIPSQVTSIAYASDPTLIVFGGKNGWIGAEAYQPSPDSMAISQDVLDIAFTHASDLNKPLLIAVGREGLLQTVNAAQEGWMPSTIRENVVFHDILRVGNSWFAAGDVLMHRKEGESDWTQDVLPQKVRWNGLCDVTKSGADPHRPTIIATGDKGSLAQYLGNLPEPQWTDFPVDDVPGVAFEYDLQASAISGDGKTWVGVGDKGSIVVAKADENGVFAPAQRISASYAAYGIVRDLLAGNPIEAALYEALQRQTEENLYDITWHNGKFYAVGSESLLMTSSDGLSWTRRTLEPKHRRLRSIVFTGDKSAVIVGEKGLMLVTEDETASWDTRQIQTERTIYDVTVSPDYPGGYIFTGAYGLWGFCEAVNGRCYRRSRNESYHYYAAAFDTGTQKSGSLRLFLAGESSQFDYVTDIPGSDAVKIEAWAPGTSEVYDMAIAERELPLLPNAARGTVGLIAAGNGMLFRSMDGGYTFRREASGLSTPIHHIAMTPDGDTVWAFDGKGRGIEDIHGLSLWKPLPAGMIDGILLDKAGYLIDSRCVYYRYAQNEPQQIACIGESMQLHDITRDGNRIVLGVRNAGKHQAAELSILTPAAKDKAPQAELRMLDFSASQDDLSNDSRVIACADQTAFFDAYQNRLLTPDNVQNHVADVQCHHGQITALTAEKTKNGIWTLTAIAKQPLWSMEIGFSPDHMRFFASDTDRWWIAAENPSDATPMVLLSRDAKSWTWRRDRITDFHAVDIAGKNAVAVGDNGAILVSEDYGQTWSPIQTKTNATLRDVCLSSDGSFGLAVGDKGTVLRAEKNLWSWTKPKYNLDFDLTSCTIAEQKDRFQVYFAGKGGAIYTSDMAMSRLELIASPSFEDIYSLATLETGEVLAVGGVYQDPERICEKGFLIEADKDPNSTWMTLLISLLLSVFWVFTLRKLFIGWKYRNEQEITE